MDDEIFFDYLFKCKHVQCVRCPLCHHKKVVYDDIHDETVCMHCGLILNKRYNSSGLKKG